MCQRFYVKLLYLWVTFCLLMPGVAAYAQAGNPVAIGEEFPRVAMKPPGSEKALSYLGIARDQYFTVKDLKADLVLVEIMNTNCASCKKQAAVYNELFSLIESDPDMKSRVKMLAIAVGNNELEIQSFQERFMVAFPIIEDPKYLMWDATGRSMTPLSIFVRQDAGGKAGVVAGSHLGLQSQAKPVFDEMREILKKAPAAFVSAPRGDAAARPHEPAPIFSEQKIMELMVMAFFKASIITDSIKEVNLSQNGLIYTSTGKRDGEPVRLFIKPVTRFLPCDACHDAQFLYIFEGSGKILDILPMQLTKYGNRPFTEKDMAGLRERVVGKNIVDPFVFDPAVDAVSGATITSSVIYKSLTEGKAIFQELKAAGLL